MNRLNLKHLILVFCFLIALSLLLVSCSDKKADLAQADQYIDQKKYDLAIQLLNQELRKGFSDTTEYQRIKQRIFIIKKHRFFAALDSSIFKRDWKEAARQIKQLKNRLKNMEQKVSRKHYFDLYYKKSLVDQHLNDEEAKISSLKKALKYWTNRHDLIQTIYEELAFYYAQKNEMVKAREMLDKSLRKTDIINLKGNLQKAFYSYMDGQYDKALEYIKEVPQEKKDKHWQNVEKFLEKYSDKLTMEDRFKLW